MLLEALWSVELSTQTVWMRAGIVVFQPRRVFGDFFVTGRILGGDRCYYYAGTYTVENYCLTGELRAVQYASEEPAIPGLGKAWKLEISGELNRHVNRDVIEVAAHLVEPVEEDTRLRLIRRVDLA